MEKLRKLIDSPIFQWSIIGVILVNAVILGLQTISDLTPAQVKALAVLDEICLVIFCIELALKLIVLRLGFFKTSWNVFDLLVVGVALAPATGSLSVLRSLRVLRLMRLATALPALRRVVGGMFRAIPGVASVAGVLMVMYYVGAVMSVGFFGETNPNRFGDLGDALFTLFKLMTLEGWPDLAAEVLEHKPHAWPFFVIFIILTTFTTLNLLFGIIVDAMEEAKEEEARERLKAQGVEMVEETNEVRLVRIENQVLAASAALTALKERLKQLESKP